jgi:subtilisin family serine protease
MANDKLEPRLITHIEDQRRRATSPGAAVTDVEGTPITVTISHQETVRPSEDASADRQTAVNDLQNKTRRSQRDLVRHIQQIAPRTTPRQHVLTNAVTVDLTPPQLEEIANDDAIALVRLERLDKVTTMRESVEVIEAREAWDELGLTGRGVRVAVLDSGVDSNHPALAGKVVDEVSTAGEPVGVPGDHGTHVAGTIASQDPVFRGVAHEADLINIKVLTAAGFGEPQFVIDGLEQAVRLNAAVANLSLGWSEIFHGWICDDADCILCEAADNAVRLGVTVVVAAGNEGRSAGPGQSNIRHPGAARRVVTVGAVDKDKQLADFSSIGPGSGRLSPGSPIRVTKPDVAAPGVDITSAIPGGVFTSLNGTSMASPHVAGLAALVLEKNGNARPAVVKKVLEDCCERLGFEPREVGYGLVNAMGTLIRNLPVKP